MGSTAGDALLKSHGGVTQSHAGVTRPPSPSPSLNHPPSTATEKNHVPEMSKSQSAAQQALALLDDLDFSVDDVPQEALDQPHQQANEAEDALQFLNGPPFSALSLSFSCLRLDEED